MKTIIAFSFLIATSLFQLTFASGNLSLNLVPKSEKKALMEISNENGHKLEINISNSLGETVYYHETNEGLLSYNRLYDFSQLENGVYSVEVKIDGASIEQMLTIVENEIEVGNSFKRVEPVFNLKGNILNLSYLNHSIEEMSMNIYQKSNLIWETKLDSEFVLHKGFDLSKLNRGEYSVVFLAGNEVYEYNLTRN